jgi:hypothetical protein
MLIRRGHDFFAIAQVGLRDEAQEKTEKPDQRAKYSNISEFCSLTRFSSFSSRFQLANKFMEFWELFSGAVSTTKEDWCEVWQHHGMDTFIDVNYRS